MTEAGPNIAAIERAEALERQLRREKLIERSVVFGTLAFLIFIVVLIYTTDNGVSRATTKLFRGETASDRLARNPVTACRDPKNKNTVWCQEYKGRQESAWRAIERQGDKANVFSLHGHEN